MEIENLLQTLTVTDQDIATAIELSKKIEEFGPMHLTMILMD